MASGVVEAVKVRRRAATRVRDEVGVVEAVLVCSVLFVLCGAGVVTLVIVRRNCLAIAITGVVTDEISLAILLTNEVVGVVDANTERGICLTKETVGVVKALFEEVAMDLKIAETGVVSAEMTRELNEALNKDAEGVDDDIIERRSCFSETTVGVVAAVIEREIVAMRARLVVGETA